MAFYFPTRVDMMKAICKPGMRVAEIGVFMGDFADELLKLEPAELVLIDPWEGRVSSGNQDGRYVREVNLTNIYPFLVDKYKSNPAVRMRRGYSYDELPKLADDTYDIIYIDSSHSYEGTKVELELAYNKVKQGGWIMLHDVAINLCKADRIYEFGVAPALNEWCHLKKQRILAYGLDGCVSVGIRIEKPGPS